MNKLLLQETLHATNSTKTWLSDSEETARENYITQYMRVSSPKYIRFTLKSLFFPVFLCPFPFHILPKQIKTPNKNIKKNIHTQKTPQKTIKHHTSLSTSHLFQAHFSSVRSVAWTSRSTAVSLGLDRRLRLWRLKEDAELLAEGVSSCSEWLGR